ncbi:hypothetical protein DM01DRAFT_1377524 [Hesseltinella vesiculosa]|uniref:Uncharacterized protein n=1 Tax=Hesseltinella vesiculosa TaxID=101127 RepID=A0A1X2G732_9FUNG|nr:hypothetical protein DM01DRAFT_1377524 [Hesseltinella vesiculosa]
MKKDHKIQVVLDSISLNDLFQIINEIKMQETQLLTLLVTLGITVVQADIDYFREPQANQRFFGCQRVQFVVDQLPDIDGKSVRANVYSDGGRQWVTTVHSWMPGSIADAERNNFQFSWTVPPNLKPGPYFVKIDTNNDQDDSNDVTRTYPFFVAPSNNPRSVGPRACGMGGDAGMGGMGNGMGPMGGNGQYGGGNNYNSNFNGNYGGSGMGGSNPNFFSGGPSPQMMSGGSVAVSPSPPYSFSVTPKTSVTMTSPNTGVSANAGASVPGNNSPAQNSPKAGTGESGSAKSSSGSSVSISSGGTSKGSNGGGLVKGLHLRRRLRQRLTKVTE